MYKISLALIFLGFFAILSEKSCAETYWPLVKPMAQEDVFNSGPPFALTTYIFGADGQPLYIIECHDRSYSTSEDTNFDYSGDFECRLAPLKEKTTYSTLFTEELHPTTDWEGSRARFFGNELEGKCALYPDYGTVREFKLRGMKITLSMHNIAFEKNLANKNNQAIQIRSFSFSINVVPDSSAISEIAAHSAYITPTYLSSSDKGAALDCSKIKKR